MKLDLRNDFLPITYTSGDIFKDDAEAITNAVNCVGVMGKGLALAFKKRFPDNFKAYKAVCDAGHLRPGGVFIFDQGEGTQPRYIVNFPTKDHWRGKSQLSYIEDGLRDLKEKVQDMNIRSIALRALGCGLGGLDWVDVKALMDDILSDVTEAEFRVYAPQ